MVAGDGTLPSPEPRRPRKPRRSRKACVDFVFFAIFALSSLSDVRRNRSMPWHHRHFCLAIGDPRPPLRSPSFFRRAADRSHPTSLSQVERRSTNMSRVRGSFTLGIAGLLGILRDASPGDRRAVGSAFALHRHQRPTSAGRLFPHCMRAVASNARGVPA